MYLHAGGNVVVRDCDIVGIFDIDNMNTEETMKDFLRRAEKNGRVKIAGDNLPKSFILLYEDGKETVIIKSESPLDLQKITVKTYADEWSE